MRISDWSSDVCSSDLGFGRVGEARLQLASGAESESLDRIVDLLIEAREREALALSEEPFITRLGVEQLAVDEEGVAEELAVGLGVLVDLERKLTELRARDRLRGVETELHVLGEIPGDRSSRQPIAVVQPRRGDAAGPDAEKIDRRDMLLRRLDRLNSSH